MKKENGKNNTHNWTMKITSSIIALLLVAAALGGVSYIKQSHTIDLKLQSNSLTAQEERNKLKQGYDLQEIRIDNLAKKQIETMQFQKNIQTLILKGNERDQKIHILDIKQAQTEITKKHISNELKKINSKLDKYFDYYKIVKSNSK